MDIHIYRCLISYDGTDFFGWQEQPKDITISSCLESCFERVFKMPVTIIGASRTDTGVHALGQVALIKTPLTLDPEIIRVAWNSSLPKSIYIREITHASKNFHPCRDVSYKIYWYQLFLKPPLPFIARFGWHFEFIHLVDIKKFQKALSLYVGAHDFGSFCKLDPQDLNNNKITIRTIDSITLTPNPRHKSLIVSIKGTSFLRYQIRRMIGYALDVARRPDLSVDYLQGVLDNPNPQQTLLKAHASGLCLRKVVYNHETT